MARREFSVRTAVLVGAGFFALVVVVELAGYLFGWRWTGYFNQNERHPQQLWDWLTLLLQPLTLALLPLWLRSRHHNGRSWVFVAVAVGVLFVVLVLGGYLLDWTWTGFTGNTVWDWLGLFLMPFLLPLVLILLVQRQSQQAARSGPATGASARAGAPEAPRQQPVSPPVAAVSVAIVVAALVAGGIGVARMSGPAASSSPTSSQAAVLPALRGVTVVGDDPFWTDTAVGVHRGDRVRVVAFGQVVAHPSWPPAGPGGRAHAGARSLLASAPHAALVAMVAPPGRTRPMSAGDPQPRAMLVGTSRSLTVPAGGDLYLGVNDLVAADNSGWFGATVELLGR